MMYHFFSSQNINNISLQIITLSLNNLKLNDKLKVKTIQSNKNTDKNIVPDYIEQKVKDERMVLSFTKQEKSKLRRFSNENNKNNEIQIKHSIEDIKNPSSLFKQS
jgi:precorrin-2 methylase